MREQITRMRRRGCRRHAHGAILVEQHRSWGRGCDRRWRRLDCDRPQCIRGWRLLRRWRGSKRNLSSRHAVRWRQRLRKHTLLHHDRPLNNRDTVSLDDGDLHRHGRRVAMRQRRTHRLAQSEDEQQLHHGDPNDDQRALPCGGNVALRCCWRPKPQQRHAHGRFLCGFACGKFPECVDRRQARSPAGRFGRLTCRNEKSG